ncbi:transcriptional regulator, TetR family [Actinacidiphila yanglinensis]|uniref:Transcriptional regulator, TetR family n=1 Tax=Actinacidiphila yanglinensis TaxID=310779 RepID=A0A1H5Z632_9ACTN|nr:TetR/AcrR family transcriptional regulator [Actinacidiphila yanglinensis]SEG31087.1 transcriptional regulator, TetR family [Actinacidiphila yanglinensis]
MGDDGSGTSSGGRTAATRRRGAELEAELLDAAWAELAEVGYARLTMEGVAARAHTGKQVLYRRWPNRAALVVAAMRDNVGSIADRVPDTGGLRGDVLAVLAAMVDRQRSIGNNTLHGLMAEAADLDTHAFTIMGDVMASVLRRAAARGEIPTAELPPRVTTVAVDLLRNELLFTREPLTDRTLTEIVDDVFLPLVRGEAHT